jgi:hypothetical protein
VPYLNGVLASRLPDVFGKPITGGPSIGDEGEAAIFFRLDAGERTSDRNGTSYEPGAIVIGPLSPPWPDAAELRKVLDESLVEAGEVEVGQRELARSLVHHLRRAGDAS